MSANRPSKKKKVHRTGYKVWIGGEYRWFRSLERAQRYFQYACYIHGVRVCQLQEVATGIALRGGTT
jgi:hypothetical protein